ncbi:MAG TPA: carboxypeptidase regulatory-like domain-containing protein [Candidatus Saccharimonadales bacterium]|jgi:hypothetical protein|nr:carboxypeptidase regulatory-like domain-containing protein [Candidatus Saccharimonadales bacterium]
MKSYLLFFLLLLLTLIVAGCNDSPAPPPKAVAPAPPPTVVIDQATIGSIAGMISFQGTPPPPRFIDMTQDPDCPSGRQNADAILIKGGKLANAFIYVKGGLPAGAFAVSSELVVLDQKGCRYAPHVLGMMAGQPLQVLNSDKAQHNVHPLPRQNNSWNESQLPHGQPIVKTFPKPELMMAIQCNQHPWMKAYLSVLKHPYFAVSGADGRFEIKNLPPGEYTLVAVHEKFGEQTLKIKVAPKESASADFIFTAMPAMQ